MIKLRRIKYTSSKYVSGEGVSIESHIGYFHQWGERGDDTGHEFFGVVEKEDGTCVELDPSQITFLDRRPED